MPFIIPMMNYAYQSSVKLFKEYYGFLYTSSEVTYTQNGLHQLTKL